MNTLVHLIQSIENLVAVIAAPAAAVVALLSAWGKIRRQWRTITRRGGRR